MHEQPTTHSSSPVTNDIHESLVIPYHPPSSRLEIILKSMSTIPQAEPISTKDDTSNSNTPTEKHLDITIVSSTVQNIPLLLPRTYVVVSCGDITQKIATTSREHTQLWNKSFHFTFDATKLDTSAEFNVRLYQQRIGKKDILLGQTNENLTAVDRNTVITRKFPHEASIQFSVGNVTRASRTFAVIIGIDKYWSDEVPNLDGCVNDAKDIEDFLLSHLNVPTSNIRVLHDKDATRHNILGTLKTHLLENPRIQHGDPIIIFFAGHGNRVAAPTGWASSDGKIETICPHDEWALVNNEVTPGIPDRTINEFIRRLADAKGNNITLIFDSCHSGGIARGEPGYTPRSFPNPCPVKTTTDKAVWGKSSSRGINRILPAGFRYDDMSSHVLLAACKPSEFAGEAVLGNQHRGLFSSVLFQKLRESHRQSSSLSYSQIIQSITPLNRVQTPQCEGKNKECLLFTLEAPIKSKLCFKIKPVKNGPGFEVELGAMHGVVLGTEFLIAQGPRKEPLGILCAEKVHSKRTILARRQGDPEFSVQDDAEASVWNWNNLPHILKVYADFKNAKKVLSSSTHPTSNFRLEESKSDAHVSISITNDGRKYQITRLPNFLSGHDIKLGQQQEFQYQQQHSADQLPLVLDSLFRFRYHLQHTDRTSSRIAVGTGSSADALVKMHLFRLGTEQFGFPVPTTSEDLFDHQGTATLSHSDIAHNYGIQITNQSTMDLFTYLFYFDPFDCSIQEWYLPPSEHMDPPLASKRALTIGYGANGGDPFNFSLEEGQTEGTGFFKLYVSTTYVDMGYLTQSSPFGAQCPTRMSKKGKPITPVDAFGSFVAKILVLS